MELDGSDAIALALAGSLSAAAVGYEFAQGVWRGKLAAYRGSARHGVASLLPWRNLVSENVVLNSNGSLLAAYEVSARGVSALSDSELEESDVGIALALAKYNSRFVLHKHDIYEPMREYARPREYDDANLAFLDDCCSKYYLSGRASRSRRILSVTWMPPSAFASRIAGMTMEGEDASADLASQVRQFEAELARVLPSLEAYASVRRLGVRRHNGKRVWSENELLSHLASRFAGRRRRVAHPPIGSSIAGLLALPMRGNYDVCVNGVETQIVVVKQFPNATREAVFDALKDLDLRYEVVVRWMPLETDAARSLFDAALKDWDTQIKAEGTIDSITASKVGDAVEARAAASEGVLRFGHSSIFVVLRGADKARTRAAATLVCTKLDDLGYPSFVTGRTSEDDFFATLPGVTARGVRRYPMHVLNLAHISSFHDDELGRMFAGADSLPKPQIPVAYATSSVGALRRLHLNNGESADALFGIGVGAQGSGKSFTELMLTASWLARVAGSGATILEKGGSAYRFVRWLDGVYYRPFSGDDRDIGLSLLSGCTADDESVNPDNSFLFSLLRSMLELQGHNFLPEYQLRLKLALKGTMTLNPNDRNLTALTEQIQDSTGVLRQVIGLYCNGGRIGGALDETVDRFAVSRITGIELGALFALNDAAYVVPMLMAILWKVRRGVQRLRESSGEKWPWLYMIDEAHALLEHTQGAEFIRRMLREARKENLGMYLWSQDIEHFAKSTIAAEIARECGTAVVFHDSQVKDDDAESERRKSYYRQFGVSRRGIAEIPYIPRRHFGWNERSSEDFSVLSWNAHPVMVAILGRSRGGFEAVGDNARVDDFIRRYPETWREELLRYEGVEPSVIADMRRFMEEFRSKSKEAQVA